MVLFKRILAVFCNFSSLKGLFRVGNPEHDTCNDEPPRSLLATSVVAAPYGRCENATKRTPSVQAERVSNNRVNLVERGISIVALPVALAVFASPLRSGNKYSENDFVETIAYEYVSISYVSVSFGVPRESSQYD